eukprot:GGOE01019331.1.p1 GENE.GGOE01019331.1~~GGOE01019331.1.p1  ORF type:complete len:878 (+),score=230.55 GGOE01019331.1:103-2736(+)
MPDAPGVGASLASSSTSSMVTATSQGLSSHGSGRKSTSAPLPQQQVPAQRRFAIQRSLRLFGRQKLTGPKALHVDLSDENTGNVAPLASASLKRSFSHPTALAGCDDVAEALTLLETSLEIPPPRNARSSSCDDGASLSADPCSSNNHSAAPAKAPPQETASPCSPIGVTPKPKGRRWFFGQRSTNTPAPVPPPTPDVHPTHIAAFESPTEADHLVAPDSDSDSNVPSPTDMEPPDPHKWGHMKQDPGLSAGGQKRATLFKWMPQHKTKALPEADNLEEGEPDTDEEFAFVALHAGQEELPGTATGLTAPQPRKLWFRRPAPASTAKPGEPVAVAEGANGAAAGTVHFGTVVGQLYVTVVEGRGLQAKQPYVAVSLQGQVQRTAALAGSSPEWTAELAFNLFDVSADVHVAVYDQPLVRGSWCVGRVAIPFASLLTPCLLAPSGALAEPVTHWYELYPPKRIRFNDDELGSKFLPGIKNIKGSGLPKPKKPLGFVRLQIQVLLCESLGKLLFTPGWQAEGQENGPPIQRVLMKNNFLRCKKAFSLPHVIRILLEDLRTVWLVPCLMFWSCFIARPWQIPPLLLIGVFIGGLVSRTHQQSLYDEITIWEENVEMEVEEGAAYRLQKYTQRVQDFQNMVGIWATAMERSANVFNWADPCITGVAFALLSLLTAALSLSLALLPVRYVCFLLGSGGYTLAVHIHRKRLAKNRGRDRKLMEKLTLPRNPLGYFLARVPDNMELTHRFICEQARVGGDSSLLPEPEGKANSRFGFLARSKEKEAPKEKPKREAALSPIKPDKEEDASDAPTAGTPEEERDRLRFFGWEREKDKAETKAKGKGKEREKDHDGEPPVPSPAAATGASPRHEASPLHLRTRSVPS